MTARLDGRRGVYVGGFIAGAVTLLIGSTLTAQSTPAAAQVTYTKDIAPVLQRSCQNCHRADGVAPMSLATYEEVRPYARAIKLRTGIGPHAGVMPPWYMEKNIGIQSFKNDPSAERRRNCQDRKVGRQRRAARQSRRHATAPDVGRREYLDDWHAGFDCEAPVADREGEFAGLVGRDSARAGSSR